MSGTRDITDGAVVYVSVYGDGARARLQLEIAKADAAGDRTEQQMRRKVLAAVCWLEASALDDG